MHQALSAALLVSLSARVQLRERAHICYSATASPMRPAQLMTQSARVNSEEQLRRPAACQSASSACARQNQKKTLQQVKLQQLGSKPQQAPLLQLRLVC